MRKEVARERKRTQIQELEELISGEKEILLKKNIPMDQMRGESGVWETDRGDAGNVCGWDICI